MKLEYTELSSEHRQRKQNYIKHLEQDVIRLREMIQTTQTEATAIKQENNSIQTILTKHNVLAGKFPSGDTQALPESDSTTTFMTLQPAKDMAIPSRSSNSSFSNISIIFDDAIDASCLQTSAPGSFNNMTSLDSPDIFKFPSHAMSQISPQAASHTSQPPQTSQQLQKPLPQLPGHSTPDSSTLPPPDLSTIAISFVLA